MPERREPHDREPASLGASRAVRTGGDRLADLLLASGVDVAFGVVSVHNLPLIDALARRLRFVPVRHEAAAVNAADGYGRARGPFGVAITSTGTGAGNAAGALVEALTAGAPVLHVTGQIDSHHLGAGRGVIHETRDQLGMLAAVSVEAATIEDPDEAVDVLRRAIEAAVSAPGGPVSVEWPIDLQYQEGSTGTAETRRPLVRALPPEPEPHVLDQAAKLLAAARRPLVWAGGGAVGARDAVDLLLRRTGAGLLTSNAGRGVVAEDDPRCVGNFATHPACAELLAAADLLVSVGTHFRSNESRDFGLPLPGPHVQIDVDPAALSRSYPADVGLCGDAAATIEALLERLPVPEEPPAAEGWADTVLAARIAARDQLRESIGPQARLCDDLRAVLPRDAVIARDVTIPSSTWGNRLLEVYEPPSNLYPRGGGIGQGMAMAVGAALGRPDVPVALLVGDGGLAVHLGELLTLAQERAWVTVVLFNDGGYGVLRNMQDRYLGRRAGVDLHTPDFGQLCGAVGLPHRLVTDVDAFRPALERSLDEQGPGVVEVDVEAIGEMPRPFVPPVPVPTA